MRKILLPALGLILVLSATPLAAQLPGTWAGTGEGSCYPEPGVVIYPWQEWKGFIPQSQDVFSGEWYDADGNHGRFEGKPIPSIPEIAVFRGYWTWETPKGIFKGGDFEMIFHFMIKEGYCEGTWTSIWPTSWPRTMKGEKVSPD